MIILDMNNPQGFNSPNSVPYKHFFFKSGESQVQVDSFDEKNVEIRLRYHCDKSMMELALLVDALRRQKVDNINLVIPYFPASRQDRVCNVGESLSVKVYADFINSLQFREVTIFDPHSEVTPALINRVKVVDNHDFVRFCLRQIEKINQDYYLVSPDAGSNKKIYSLGKALNRNLIIRCDKSRDVTNGKLGEPVVFADDLTGQTCVIIDDICSRGGTFQALAKKLKEKGAKHVYLIVSHYEDVANLRDMKDSGIEKIFCTNSIRDVVTSDFLNQENVFNFIA